MGANQKVEPDIGQAYHAEIAACMDQLGPGAWLPAWGELTPEQQGHWRVAAVHAYARKLWGDVKGEQK